MELGERLVDRAGALGGRLGHVVPYDEFTLGFDAGDQLVELKREKAPVGAELHHVLGDLGGDPAHHLQPLGHRRDIADRDQVLDLEGRQRARDLVEAELVALQGRQGLVGAGEDRGGVFEDTALAVHVEGDQAHRLGDRDDREVDLLAHPVCGAVPGACLLRRDGRVGHQLHARPQDLGDVLVDHDAAVELAQLAQPCRGELDVQHEAAGTHRLDGLVGPEHDESSGVAAEDPLEPVAQGRAGCHGAQCGAHQAIGTGAPTGLSGSCCPVVGCHCTPRVAGVSGRPWFVRMGETRAKSTGALPPPVGPLDDATSAGRSARLPCRRLPGPSCREGSCRDRSGRGRA